ncbi:hypothetical protein [Cohnella sp. GCM10027633]|uniref:hypothetical protein n=1 Tax=unclassified Cohnella TaxID=2636738 RepID=UPI0036321F9A
MFQDNEQYIKILNDLRKPIEDITIAVMTMGEISDQQKEALYNQLAQMSAYVSKEPMIPRDLTDLLFKFYLRVTAEGKYKEQKDRSFLFFIGKLQTYLAEILCKEDKL